MAQDARLLADVLFLSLEPDCAKAMPGFGNVRKNSFICVMMKSKTKEESYVL